MALPVLGVSCWIEGEPGGCASSLRRVTTELSGRVHRALESLTPGYFALVMATGIISIGMRLEGYSVISWGLLAITAAAFVALVSLTAWRFVAYRQAVNDDFNDPRRGFGFFTFVAATNVLGVRLGAEGHYGATAFLLLVSGISWLVLGYVVPWTAALGRKERPIVADANGTWFIWVVASQSVAIAAATLEPVFQTGRRELALLAVMSWSVGVFLYAAAGIFVSLRLMLYKFGPEELTPPILGLHGCPGDHGPRRSTHRRDGGCTDGAGDARTHRRPGGGVLGIRDMVDPGSGRRWMVASCRAASSAPLRSDAVEHHLPARHVRRRRYLPRPSRPAADCRDDRPRRALGGLFGLGDRVRRNDQTPVAERLHPGQNMRHPGEADGS